jgi:DMSO/TMAO reductase YedYZ molybdopterin-dependent catalytic subunit
MKNIITPLLIYCLLVISVTIHAQDSSGALLVVEGDIEKPLKLSTKDLSSFPQAKVKAKDKEGNEHTFKGVLLSVILDSAGVPLGKLRGENLVKYVLVMAADGYAIIYALPEIDPEFASGTVLLATHVDGKPLPKGEGPFRVVNTIDKKPTRWVREVTTIKILKGRH